LKQEKKRHAPFAHSTTRRLAAARTMTSRRIDAKELKLYRVLAKFSQNAGQSRDTSLLCSKELFIAVRELLKDNYQPSKDLVGHIIATIDATLYQNFNNSRSSQRRNRDAPSDGNLQEFDRSLDVLYLILRELNFKDIYDKIDGSLFCRHSYRTFIFPGYPSKDEYDRKGWRFSHRQFLLPSHINNFVKGIPFNRVQYVVHNVKDLLNILHLIDPERELDVGLRLCLKGRPSFVYNGPNLIWFSPVPPPKFVDSPLSPSRDPDNSRYGCFRLTLPFRVIERKYPEVYCLGTRKYNQEYCHSYLLTPTGENVKFIRELEPIELASSKFVKKKNSHQLYWFCYRDDPDTAWDSVDFAVSANELNLSIESDQIRLDFVDHSSPCVPTINTPSCKSPKSKNHAMRQFLEELEDIDIDISKLKNIFEDDVYNDLIQFIT
jgi:hypothetical protein